MLSGDGHIGKDQNPCTDHAKGERVHFHRSCSVKATMMPLWSGPTSRSRHMNELVLACKKGRKPEVCEFRSILTGILGIDEDVYRFDVAMDNIFLVSKVQIEAW